MWKFYFTSGICLIFFSFLLLIIFVMVGMAFLSLLEHKVLGYVYICKSPNRVGFVGILQPFRDAIKLFSREQYFPLVYNYLIYYLSPIFGFFLCWFGCWSLIWAVLFHLSCEQAQDGIAVPSWSCSQAVSKHVRHTPSLCVQWETPDYGQGNCLKHVEFLSKIK
jgi:NADH-ubiquinone oxidoreductase chain 1